MYPGSIRLLAILLVVLGVASALCNAGAYATSQAHMFRCEELGRRLHQHALEELLFRDSVTELAPNPPRLPLVRSVPLEPGLPGWRRLAANYSVPIRGRASVRSTPSGFVVDVVCNPGLDGQLVHLRAEEGRRLYRITPRLGGDGLAPVAAFADDEV